MSFPNSPVYNSSPDQNSGQSRQNKPKLRSVRLELPSKDFPRKASPGHNLFPPPTQQTGSFNSSIPINSSQTPKIGRTSVTAVVNGAKLMSPSVFYQFPENCEASFILDVVTPDNAFPFSAHPGMELNNPRFLLYTICSTSISTSPVKIILNGTTRLHWITDPRPLDVTDILVPFGQQNWLIVETGSFVVPFAVVGVWSSFFSLTELIHEIDQRDHFVFSEVAAICPITGQQIETPSKGANCNHEQCFDLVSYITTCQALGFWICPICQQQVYMADLRIGQRPSYSFSEAPVNQATNNWGEQDHSIVQEVPISSFWGDDDAQ